MSDTKPKNLQLALIGMFRAIGLIEAECREELAAAATAEAKLRVAFTAAKDHWMFTDKNEQIRGAIGAAMLHMSEEDKTRVEEELRAFNALFGNHGLPIDLAQLKLPENPIGISKLWREINGLP